MKRRASFILAMLAIGPASATGPTPVPSVRPGVPIGPVRASTPVAEGRWVGYWASDAVDAALGDFVVFDVQSRHISNLRVSLRDNECVYADGRSLKFPFTLSRAAGADAMTLIPIDANGRASVTTEVSDSGHKYNMSFSVTLARDLGTAEVQGVSVGGTDRCTMQTLFIPMKNTGPTPAEIKQPCGYPWSPPDCSNASPLLAPDTGSSGPATPPRP